MNRTDISEKNRKGKFRRFLTGLLLLPVLFLLLLLLLNGLVYLSSAPFILTPEEAAADGSYDCILVLGCGLQDDGSPSPMLRHRLETAVSLYFSGAAPKLLMSGDHGSLYYNEVQAMKDYALAEGVPEEDIFMDHAGFSTYESMFRAAEVFEVRRPLIVTQKYHLYRAVYIARSFDLEADGVDAGMQMYALQAYRELREMAARAKDYLYCILKPAPTYLGETIPISGDGTRTAD